MKLELKVRRFLSAWQLWMGIAWLAIVAIVVGLVVVRNQTLVVQSQVERAAALHHSEIVSTANSTYNACLQSIPELTRISVHLRGVNQLAAAVLANAGATLKATPRGDRDYVVRFENYARILGAVKRIANVRELPVPTPDNCRARRTAVLAAGGITR